MCIRDSSRILGYPLIVPAPGYLLAAIGIDPDAAAKSRVQRRPATTMQCDGIGQSLRSRATEDVRDGYGQNEWQNL